MRIGSATMLTSQPVFVLGAGFTKAFLPTAPLLVDDFGGEKLRTEFAPYPDVAALVDLELSDCSHPRPGLINLERLMTRLDAGMPYDKRIGNPHAMTMLLKSLKDSLARRIADARAESTESAGELLLFARNCCSKAAHCITFNYDDLLDEALGTTLSWAPDFGYGFPCRAASTLLTLRYDMHHIARMLLLKLHGSVNWRVALGQPRPFLTNSILHFGRWHSGSQGIGATDVEYLKDVEPFLDPEPFIVPPVLSKADLSVHPVLARVWEVALSSLKQATSVVFIGYSMPLTDVSTGFLFREGLTHLPSTQITVVDLSPEPGEKRERLKSAFRSVFPTLAEEQFYFKGAVPWIREHLTNWLFDSNGSPVAFESSGWFVSKHGRVLGSRYANTQIGFNRQYRGETIDQRIFHRLAPPSEDAPRESRIPQMPAVPPMPSSASAVPLPSGFRDLTEDELTPQAT